MPLSKLPDKEHVKKNLYLKLSSMIINVFFFPKNQGTRQRCSFDYCYSTLY